MDEPTLPTDPKCIDEIRWAPRVNPAAIRRLYETDALGIVDEAQIDRVGYALSARCQSILRATEAHRGRVAYGGFEADPRLRATYLGPNWDVAKVRGTPFNTGDGLRMALDAGAQPYGHWSGCHAVFWDAGAPPSGDWELTNRLSRLSYPIGIVVNAEGRRFLDEGAVFGRRAGAAAGRLARSNRQVRAGNSRRGAG